MIFEYRCEKDHLTESYFPIAKASKSVVCSTCGKVASRRFSSVGCHMNKQKYDIQAYNKRPEHLKTM